jgi:hypothetical protein
MTVLSRGARVRRGGRRPGWVLLTALLVLAIGASSALVFTNRVELLKLAVILALWAAVAGAFVSVLYRRQSDADQSRVRDLKLVYDLQLDREISARREYELTVESQLRRELASELRAQAADDVAALRAELAALRTSLEILFDTDLEHHRALEKPQTLETDAAPARAYSDWARNGESPPVDWVSSDRVTAVRPDSSLGQNDGRTDETSIIDVPEVGVLPHDERVGVLPREREVPPPSGGVPLPAGGGPLLPPRQPAPPHDRVRPPYEAPPPAPAPRFEPRQPPPPPPPPQPPPMPPPAEPQLQPQMQPEPQEWQPESQEGQPEPQEWQPEPQEWQPEPQEWRPAAEEGQWLPAGAPGSNWSGVDSTGTPTAAPSGRRRRARHSSPDAPGDSPPAEAEPPYSGSSRRSRSRHSTEYQDHGVSAMPGTGMGEPLPPPPAARPPDAPPPPRLAPAPPPEPAPRHRSADSSPEEPDGQAPRSGGQSVADLLARLQVEPTGGGRRRRRDG